MAMAYRGSVVVLDDGTDDTHDLVERVTGIFPDVYRMTASHSDDDHAVRVDRAQLDVKTLVRTMVAQEAYWGLFPKGRDPVAVISDYLSTARPALAEGFPAFVLVAAAPGVRYRRIAIVADVRAPVTTGVLALTGVGLATHLGCSLDVLILGADAEAPPRNWHEVERLLEIRAGAVDLERALEVAVERNLTVNWIAVGESGRRDQLVLDAVVDGGYDLVLDDVSAIDLGPFLGRRKRVKRQLVDQRTDTAYRLLRDAPCDVGIVVDAVTMRLVRANAVAAGAAAALSVGVVGSALPSQPNAQAAATMVPTAEAPVAPAAEAVAQAQEEAPAEPAPAPPAVTTPAPPLESLPGRIDRGQYGQYQATSGQAEAEAAAARAELDARVQQQAAADQAVAMAQTDLALERRDVTSARATAESAEDRLDYAETGRDRLTDAEETRALGSLNASRRDLQRQEADVADAEAALAAARDAAAAAAAAVAAQQPVVDAHNANMASWGAFLGEASARTPRVVSPVPGYSITTAYGVSGARWSSGRHTGVDFAAPSGTSVVAAADGVVTFAGGAGAYGNQIKIRHADGTSTTYAHLSSIGVSVGQQVSAGQRIGGVGSTGNSTGPHLHFELLDTGGGFRNPQPWLQANGAL